MPSAAGQDAPLDVLRWLRILWRSSSSALIRTPGTRDERAAGRGVSVDHTLFRGSAFLPPIAQKKPRGTTLILASWPVSLDGLVVPPEAEHEGQAPRSESGRPMCDTSGFIEIRSETLLGCINGVTHELQAKTPLQPLRGPSSPSERLFCPLDI